ncbi:alkylhydroperoxidase [Bacillus pseudomycoides]|uniref:Alkylhydroperoxidase n=1 Tax=Bacillus pseudomycoides TaxID=64104 RepID=A0AA91VDX5_9BACI|nr:MULTISPECIES: carboxymuconolactone decarboxylase family protein [Bacillus]PEB54828.1 alkylhydroperoxidase [Bacillus sp. AFS098217]PED83211.1 alkylhydroperoxidase [Bacillus pseudomycoides]PEU14064.1 alkylhydroperoxidase [Bacillus sp. AFS019443]PEU17618.1 alkylhydroperoxidase [Bacillus sp. AFS014408]PFW62304.1 alkylhydroperoxidase [Bacillus sp. AFS075034]
MKCKEYFIYFTINEKGIGGEIMERILLSNIGETKFQKLLGHCPNILQSWNSLENTLYETGTLSEELKEQVRRTLAFGNECPYCMAKGKPDDVQKAEEISTAVTFAHLFVHNRSAIDNRMFDVLKGYWSEAEIVELCAYICFITASQQLGFLFQLQPE